MIAWILHFPRDVLCVFAVSLKYNNGFTRLWPSLFTLVFGAGNLYMLLQAIETLPLGTPSAVWGGMVGLKFTNVE